MFRRKEDDHPPFNPEALDTYVFREAHVTHWAQARRFMITVYLGTPLYSHRMKEIYLAKRILFGFSDKTPPFLLKEATIQDSAITFCVIAAPGYLERFIRTDPLRIQCATKLSVKQRIEAYTFSEFKPPD